MKIIGHRGAAWLALENTVESIKAARAAGVDAVEFDIHMTADGEFVLCHDATTGRISSDSIIIADHTLQELRSVVLHNGEGLATLEMGVKAAGTTPVFLDIKGSGWAAALARKLAKLPMQRPTVIALDHEELAKFHRLMPKVPAYVVQRFNPIDTLHALQVAKGQELTGVDLNFWLLNPLTYWLAMRYGLSVVVYSVNYPWIAHFLRVLFPRIAITTDRPDRLQLLRAPSHQTRRS